MPSTAYRLSKKDEREPLAYWVDVQTDLSLLVVCAFCSVLAIKRGMNENRTGWMYRLTCVFAGQTGLIVVLSYASSFVFFTIFEPRVKI